ncbi:MAG: AAA family ATPase [Thermoguttaceae bacterium]|nr:AAA family ATPase [Thermoguttaceae bacterium]
MTTLNKNNIEKRLAICCQGVQTLKEQLGRVLVGLDDVVESSLIAIAAKGHALLEGVPGLGKTLLVRSLAEAIEGTFSRIQFTPDLMPADITGTNVIIPREGSHDFEFHRGPIFANIVLADEINRATPKTQAALLEAMQEHSVTVSGLTHRLDGMFSVFATQNPLEMEGTYPLPEAQLDRFFCKLLVAFPQENELAEILRRTTCDIPSQVEKTVAGSLLLDLGQCARMVPVSDELLDMVVSTVLASHPGGSSATPKVKKYVRYGASPWGGQSLMLGAKIRSLLCGRFNITSDDIRTIAPMVLRHRIILNFEGHAEGITTDEVIEELLAGTRHV